MILGHSRLAVRPGFVVRCSITTARGAVRTRSTLSKLWIPTGGVSPSRDEDGHAKLVRAGFIRQSQSGIFQLLPLGLRVQEKLEALIDGHMHSIGASRLSLSTITSEELWQRSGRLSSVSSELFRLRDRKDTALMLSPTHEEEITSLVAGTLNSYKDLPLRLFQITRKYRDEKRPRHGLLRSREFLMKDLYTFDVTPDAAAETYQAVSAAYAAFFADLKLPILVAEASSGDMGGNHSHEYHLAHAIGEDTVAQCDSCGFTANDEVMVAKPSTARPEARVLDPKDVRVWRGVTKDHATLVNLWYYDPSGGTSMAGPNLHAARKAVPDLDLGISDAFKLWTKILSAATERDEEVSLLNVVDGDLASNFAEYEAHTAPVPFETEAAVQSRTITQDADGAVLSLQALRDGQSCHQCGTGTLKVHKALELGHTFLLGTRYSEPLRAQVALPNTAGKPVPVQMGCFGIGISRILGAVAEHLVDDRGLNWPRAIAPYEVVVIPTSGVTEEVISLFDGLSTHAAGVEPLDMVLDDRKASFGWKMRDADTIGYPVAVILGKSWQEQGLCEVQCRRLAINEKVRVETLASFVRDVLARL